VHPGPKTSVLTKSGWEACPACGALKDIGPHTLGFGKCSACGALNTCEAYILPNGYRATRWILLPPAPKEPEGQPVEDGCEVSLK
jgi:hypothetical protein